MNFVNVCVSFIMLVKGFLSQQFLIGRFNFFKLRFPSWVNSHFPNFHLALMITLDWGEEAFILGLCRIMLRPEAMNFFMRLLYDPWESCFDESIRKRDLIRFGEAQTAYVFFSLQDLLFYILVRSSRFVAESSSWLDWWWNESDGVPTHFISLSHIISCTSSWRS